MLESQLILKSKSGDGEAFRKLLNSYRNKLFGYLWRYANSKENAEELVQETLIKVWNGFAKYNEQKKFSSWLFTIAHNVAMDSLRTKAKENSTIPFERIEDIPFESKPDDVLLQKENVDMIYRAVENLSEKQKKVFLLRQHGELSFKEIAELLDEPLNTVLSHMRYSIKNIRKQLKENSDESRKRSVI